MSIDRPSGVDVFFPIIDVIFELPITPSFVGDDDNDDNDDDDDER